MGRASMTAPADRATREQAELAFWNTDPLEGPGTIPVEVVIKKMSEARVLLQCLDRYDATFGRATRILELGAGQGWASCVVKRRYPGAELVVTELSPAALSSLPQWERILGVSVDDARACSSDATGLEDESVDLVFAFAAAHHFAAKVEVLREMKRVLRPGGNGLFLYEPSTPRRLYPFAFRRVNRKRPQVLEDVMVPADLEAAAAEVGLRFRVDYFPSIADRGPTEFLYYLSLSVVAPLQRILPCTANFSFENVQEGRVGGEAA
jgi:SAM-dependent methyltransferase